MSIGSTLAVEDAEDQYREDSADFIARHAAALVASGDMGRNEAIETVTDFLRRGNEGQGDITMTESIENRLPTPSKQVQPEQVAAIKKDLEDAARDAADTL